MSVRLDHTIVEAHDRRATADFLAAVLGLAVGAPYGPFLPIEVDNGVTLDVMGVDGPVRPQHYAFLIEEDDFDAVLARLEQAGASHWADPMYSREGEINHEDGGRGMYFVDPNGHRLEVITRRYGSGG
jgi:extradiol dioxygenase family protein